MLLILEQQIKWTSIFKAVVILPLRLHYVLGQYTGPDCVPQGCLC